MIIADNFIWLHFPKTAGTNVEQVLRSKFGCQSNIAFDKIDLSNVIWHHSIDERRLHDPDFDTSGKPIICNIRRLPYWLLSRIYFEYNRNPKYIVDRKNFVRGRFFEANGFLNTADFYAQKYGKNVSYWIRVENLIGDFTSVFSNFLDLHFFDVESELKRKINANKIKYIKELAFYFTPEELQILYESNPFWMSLEQKIYGNILEI